jgi:predicted nucleic acid-binding protein
MSWWTTALYDTCSIITLDKLLLERPGLSRQFPSGFLALEESYSADQMRAETVARMRGRATPQALPPAPELAELLRKAKLPRALAAVDLLVYATAVHSRLPVVTADKRLARAIAARGLQVGNIALILKQLVVDRHLSEKACERVLQGLAARKDLILGIPNPTWDDLKDYRFPN